MEQVNVPLKPAPVSASDAFGAFASAANGKARKMVVENDLFRATISSKGATLTSLVLKKHLDGALQPVQLVSNRADGALSLLFLTREGRKIDTRDLYFTGVPLIRFTQSRGRRATVSDTA